MVDFGIIIQARSNSKRFKKKVFKKVSQNQTLLDLLIKRLKKNKKIRFICLATPKNDNLLKFHKIAQKNQINFFNGSENNVLKRYYDCAKKFKIQNIVRITADCPLTCPKLLDKMIEIYKKRKLDYCSNIIEPSFPDGFDIEIFNFKSLKKSILNVKSQYYKEHVTKYIINNNNFKKYNYKYQEDLSKLRATVDYPDDLKNIKYILKKLRNNANSDYITIINVLKKKLKLSKIEKFIHRNMSEHSSVGQRMWLRAKNIIPGGSMLFSKNPDLYLPKKWPAYFIKTSKCNIWGIDKKKYLDMSIMGVGTNILGYSNKEVDRAVLKVINNGNMSSLNNQEEVLLAEKLVEMHPWADMVRHVRTGAESNSLAIRLARAYTGKNKIAVCGYHGWQDWYLSANLDNTSNLNNHLIKNLNVKGVDSNLKNTIKIFDFNDEKILSVLRKSSNYAAVIVELARDRKQTKSFINKIRKICLKKGIILIFDECTSGFRETFGGLHLNFGINPDIATFGKALGNGYSICSILGNKEIMQQAQNTFASSTFWTDRIGPSAGLKTLEIMRKLKSWEIISTQGKKIKKSFKKISLDTKVPLKITGLDALPKFYFNKNHNIYKTFVSQEFLKKNILASNTIYTCIHHDDKKIDRYMSILHEIFLKIKENQKNNINPLSLLDTDEAIRSIRG